MERSVFQSKADEKAAIYERVGKASYDNHDSVYHVTFYDLILLFTVLF